MNAASADRRQVVAAVAGLGWAPQPRVVAWAAAEAALRRAPLRLVHGYATLPYGSPAEDELLRAAARAELADAVLLARCDRPGLRVSGRLLPERPDLALQAASARAAVVVLGTATHTVPDLDARYGSAVGMLLTTASCPVVAVPGYRPGLRHGAGSLAGAGHPVAGGDADGPVVVATDGTPVSEPAVAFAFDAAARRGAPLAVVRCWPAGQVAGPEPEAPPAGALAGVAERYPDVAVIDASTAGDPAEVLTRWSYRASLLVVGNHGRDRWATTVWGSVSRALVRDAACPVAVVRPLPHRRDRRPLDQGPSVPALSPPVPAPTRAGGDVMDPTDRVNGR